MSGEVRTASDAVEVALAAVAARESVVHAFAHLDADGARADAVAVDERGGLLAGLVLGVKDVFDTADQPTAYGSPIHAGHRPAADAAAVALLRAAGAVVLGKTVTAELALFHPGPTTNPHDPAHTPGGSSMGSAAAVAAGMVDVGLGTQTAGSVIRPASFCGVYGFKPTYGLVPTAGVKQVGWSLDTVGWFAREADLLGRLLGALTGRQPPVAVRPPRIGVVRTEQWDEAAEDTQRAVERAAERAARAGAVVFVVELPELLVGLAAEQPLVMGYEAARSLAWERHAHPYQLSDQLRDLLDWGASIDVARYDEVNARARAGRAASGSLFGGVDVLLTPAVVGEAPRGLDATGDPRFARLWTLLGWPAVSVPGCVGSSGLPVGVQLVGPPLNDGAVLAAAKWLGEVLR